jgi:DNA-binding CsgD family transcriptional regulator
MMDIINYENLYFISDDLKFYSYPKKTRKGIREIKPWLNKNGYLMIDLVKNKKVTKFLCHRLIAECFIENKNNKPQVNHINGIKTDNRVENLEWCTVSENRLHAFKTNLQNAKGEKNSSCKLNNKIVLLIFEDKRNYKEISQQYNISIPTISNIKNKHTWKHLH